MVDGMVRVEAIQEGQRIRSCHCTAKLETRCASRGYNEKVLNSAQTWIPGFSAIFSIEQVSAHALADNFNVKALIGNFIAEVLTQYSTYTNRKLCLDWLILFHLVDGGA
jgi:hypothetical protein